MVSDALWLAAHPTTPGRAIAHVGCTVRRSGAGLELVYAITGDMRVLVIPPVAKPSRSDGLWRSTCTELFVAGAEGGYREFNFAPSGQWAAYRFTGRREGMAPLDFDMPPSIHVADKGHALILSVRLHRIQPGPLRVAITAVIEEKGGIFSYWALRHGGDKPDFHDPDCFVLELPPAD